MKDKLIKILVLFVMMILGVSLLLWSDKVTTTVSIVFGITLALYGLLNAYQAYKGPEKDSTKLVAEIIVVIVGMILVIKPNFISEIISFVIGIYILFSSLISLRTVLDNKASKKYKTGLILSVSGVAIGVLCILGKLLVPNIILSVLGALIVIYSIIGIINVVILPNSSKK